MSPEFAGPPGPQRGTPIPPGPLEILPSRSHTGNPCSGSLRVMRSAKRQFRAPGCRGVRCRQDQRILQIEELAVDVTGVPVSSEGRIVRLSSMRRSRVRGSTPRTSTRADPHRRCRRRAPAGPAPAPRGRPPASGVAAAADTRRRARGCGVRQRERRRVHEPVEPGTDEVVHMITGAHMVQAGVGSLDHKRLLRSGHRGSPCSGGNAPTRSVPCLPPLVLHENTKRRIRSTPRGPPASRRCLPLVVAKQFG